MRKQKIWALSDQIRDKLKEFNVTIEDNKDGTKWQYSHNERYRKGCKRFLGLPFNLIATIFNMGFKPAL